MIRFEPGSELIKLLLKLTSHITSHIGFSNLAFIS